MNVVLTKSWFWKVVSGNDMNIWCLGFFAITFKTPLFIRRIKALRERISFENGLSIVYAIGFDDFKKIRLFGDPNFPSGLHCCGHDCCGHIFIYSTRVYFNGKIAIETYARNV